jgi:hypothetical protein
MLEKSHLRQLNLKGLDSLTGIRESPCQLIELVTRAEGVQQGDVRHPALEVAIVDLTYALNGWLHLAGRDEHDGSGNRFSLHTAPHK